MSNGDTSSAKRSRMDVDLPADLGEAVAANLRQYLAFEMDSNMRKDAERIVQAKDSAELKKRFTARLQFGTAGLRGPMGGGLACMNDLTVTQATQGLLAYLKGKNKGKFSVVVGYDARHNSRRFALRTAAVLLADPNVSVHFFSDICPTPYVAYATYALKCAAGVMITASHNPKEDNGYKVYWSNGAQIIPPHDKGIAAEIDRHLEPSAECRRLFDEGKIEGHDRLTDVREKIGAEYQGKIKACSWLGADVDRSAVKFTYTAMHGVGHDFCKAAFASFGLPPFVPVAEQVVPDPNFPTVQYPNPEEGAGALELSIKTADANGSTVILANDPDADRLAVAAKHKGEWRVFTGNEIGALFAWWAWHAFQSRKPKPNPDSAYMLSSTVSSMILRTMAEAEGFNFEDTLTGFKWMGNRARELEAKGKEVLFAFEEAIGFCVGTIAYDKDGVNASAVMAELALHLASQGRDLVEQLDHIYATYGYHATNNSYFFCYSQPTIDKIFLAMRKDGKYPQEIGGSKVVRVRDLTTGYDNGQPDNKAILPTQSSNMLTFYLANKCTLTLRTSGTEPKIKYYSEICAPPGSTDRAAVEKQLADVVNDFVQTWMKPKENGLVAKGAK